MRSLAAWGCLLALATAPGFAAGQDLNLSFDDAAQMLLSRSDALAGARANVDSLTHRSNSLDYLDYPRVGFDAKVLESEKTFDVNLTGIKSAVGPALSSVLGSTAATALASQIPSSTVLGVHNSGLQSNVTATLPLYTGGKIDATQKAAEAGIRQAGAEMTLTEQGLRTQLVQIYFAYQLAERVLDVRREVLGGLELHLKNAQRAEKAGVVAHAQTLQAQVARDEAERNQVQAEADVRSVAVALTNLLHLERPPNASTPLFVVTKGIAPVQAFIEAARTRNGQLAKLEAMNQQSGEGVRIERSARLPEVYAFGEYNLTGRNWDMTMPDWAFGLGLKYQLFSGIDRSEAEESAVQRQFQVQAMQRQARNDIETQVTRAYNDLIAARDKFRLLDSNIALAKENVRLQDASFREGVSTSVDVVDARLALSRAKIERAQAAYQFDDALARLLAASGQAEAFSRYVAEADRVITQ